MAASFEFAIVRLAPKGVRDERINIGLVVFAQDGLDVRLSRRLDRVRAFSAAIDIDELRSMLMGWSRIDERLRLEGIDAAARRLEVLSNAGPIGFSALGRFTAELTSYEERITSILSAMVEPEPAPVRIRAKRSRLLTQMKKAFRSERVLADKGEGLGSHRIVPAVEMDEGLIADLVLKNGSFHVVETVDASGEADVLRRALGDIGISALVLERARMKFGSHETQTRLVYSASSTLERGAMPSLEAAAHQGAILTNWLSADDRERFLQSMSSLAEPLPRKGKSRAAFDFRQIRIL